MEEKLLKLFKLADELNKKQDKVYAEIVYRADDNKKLEIKIKLKKDFSFVEKCEINLTNNSIIKWNNIIEIFTSYVGGVSHE
jgi:uncharacterized coiled-coil DUF342 family protein